MVIKYIFIGTIVILLFILIIFICDTIYNAITCNRLSKHPNIQIGKKFEWRMHLDNPFESDIVSIAEIIDLKERNGCGWVKYKCHDHDSIYTEPISSFADKYNKEV